MPVQQNRLELDSNVRRSSKGTALIGGSPFRVIRLSNAGAGLLDRWLAGEPNEIGSVTRGSGETSAVETGPAGARSGEQQLRERLTDAGMVHPIVESSAEGAADLQVAFVVPVFDDPAGLDETMRSVRVEFGDAMIVVVDDHSVEAEAVAAVVASHHGAVLRHAQNLGPAAARNTGWRAALSDDASLEVVVFLDADVAAAPGACAMLLAHLADESVVAVAGRVRARPGADALSRYEIVESPLDLGENPALVRPGSRVPYVPSAALAVRTIALSESGGFDQSMRVGEDVDLIWRLAGPGRHIRYEPRAIAHHRNRGSLVRFAAQRFGYGTAAGRLSKRHVGQLAPVELPVTTAAAWAMGLFGGPKLRAAAVVLASFEAVGLARKIGGTVDDPLPETVRLTVMGHSHAATWLAKAVTRAWLPVVTLSSFRLARARNVLGLAGVVVPMVDWLRKRPSIDPARYIALRALDDASYCAGVWRGVAGEQTAAPLLPRLRFDRFWRKS